MWRQAHKTILLSIVICPKNYIFIRNLDGKSSSIFEALNWPFYIRLTNGNIANLYSEWSQLITGLSLNFRGKTLERKFGLKFVEHFCFVAEKHFDQFSLRKNVMLIYYIKLSLNNKHQVKLKTALKTNEALCFC